MAAVCEEAGIINRHSWSFIFVLVWQIRALRDFIWKRYAEVNIQMQKTGQVLSAPAPIDWYRQPIPQNYNARPTINGSTVPIARTSRFAYGSLCRIWRIALSRARFLQSERTTAHGESAVSVYANIASLASVYSFHLSSDARSTGLSFHCLSG
jgi:hypothetical protein